MSSLKRRGLPCPSPQQAIRPITRYAADFDNISLFIIFIVSLITSARIFPSTKQYFSYVISSPTIL
jgi:hypothetical protein